MSSSANTKVTSPEQPQLKEPDSFKDISEEEPPEYLDRPDTPLLSRSPQTPVSAHIPFL
jgi:hypothetical protein